MDKVTFVEKAPYYYALAIAVFLNDKANEYVSIPSIENYYLEKGYDAENHETYDYLRTSAVFAKAIELVVEFGLATIRRRDFGPAILRKYDNLDAVFTELGTDDSLPFQDYLLLDPKEREFWLLRTLRHVNDEANRLLITQQDFEKPTLDWEPIAIERNNTQLIEATAALGRAIEELRGSNGYSVAFPEERSFVLGELEEGARVLEQADTTNRSFIRRKIIEPLNILISRGRKAALGIAAQAARQAILEWLVTHGKEALTILLGNW